MEIEKEDMTKDLEDLKDTPVGPAVGMASIALNLAMKYHDMQMVSDGTLYQQYKLEGRNMTTIGLADVFETAIQIEKHLMGSRERIAKFIAAAFEIEVEDEPDGEASGEPVDTTPPQD